MNKPIRTMSIFCLVLFMALLLNITYLQYVDADHLNSRPDNKRVRDAEFSRKRGAIVAGGNSVAESVKSKDQYKYQRVYKLPLKYAQLTGYYSYIYGRAAIEQSQNDILSGSDPRLFVNRVVDMLGNAQPKGGSVSLTVNPKAQTAAYDGLKALGKDAKGAVVALEPSTGKILALSSTPSYDPNLLASHQFSQVQRSYARLSQSKDQKMLDRGIQETYPPGSTFKLVTTAAALSSGQYTPNTKVAGGASIDLPQTSVNLPNEPGLDCGTTRITLTQALENSCNTAFAEIGLKLGDDALRAQAQKFGFDQTYLEDLPGQVRSRYDVAATPLQMAVVAAGIANGGTVMRPYVVDEVRAPDLSVLDKTNPEAFRSNAVSSSVARDLTQMMIEVVDNGTAQTAQIPGVKVAGKTGTAQRGPGQAPYAWFVSFAPADDPKVAVAVFVDDPSVPRGEVSGSGIAAPIAKKVMEAVIQ
jgi:peptidoglycan glycosyltransferase